MCSQPEPAKNKNKYYPAYIVLSLHYIKTEADMHQ